MKTAVLPAVRVSAEFRADVEGVLHEGENLSSLVLEALRDKVEQRRDDAAFEAEARMAEEEYERTGISRPIDQVFSKLEAQVASRRQAVIAAKKRPA